jgi:hypothetical protein
VLIVLVSACSSTLNGAPPFMRQLVDPFVTEGFACTGPSVDASGMSQWDCSREGDDGTEYRLVVDGDVSEIRQVAATVDQSGRPATDAQIALTYFTTLVSRELASDADPVLGWLKTNIGRGGHQTFGRIVVTCDPFGTVTNLSLFTAPS